MKAGRILSFFVVVVVMLFASIASAQKMMVAVVLNEPTNEFFVAAMIFQGTPPDPAWQPQDPGDVIHGLAGFIFDMTPSGTLTLQNTTITAPQANPVGFWLFNSVAPLGGGVMRVASFQPTVFSNPAWIYQGVGTTTSPSWSWPVLLAQGTYTGSGTLDVVFPVSGQAWTYVSVLYGQPAGWTNPAKVDAFKTTDVLTFPASTTQ